MARVVCRNPDCPASAERMSVPPSMECVGETASGWIFRCGRCAKDGRVSRRVMTKDLVGGTFGSGRRDDGSGQSAGEAVSKFVFGANLTP